MCGVAGVVSGAIFAREAAGAIASYLAGATIAAETPWILGIGAASLVVDLVLNYSPGDPMVDIKPGPSPLITQPKFPVP